MEDKLEYSAADMASAAAGGWRDGQRAAAEAAQSAPAGEREAAVEAAYAAVVEGGWSSVKEMGVEMFQAGAAWQRTQAAGVPEGWKLVEVELLELLREMVDLHERRGTVLTVHMEQLRALLAAPAQPAVHHTEQALDMVAPAQPEVQRLREALESCLELIETISPFEGDTVRKARAALAASTGQEVE